MNRRPTASLAVALACLLFTAGCSASADQPSASTASAQESTAAMAEVPTTTSAPRIKGNASPAQGSALAACASIVVAVQFYLYGRDSGMPNVDPTFPITVREAVRSAAEAYNADPAFLPIRDAIWNVYQSRSFGTVAAFNEPLRNAMNTCVAAFPSDAVENGWGELVASF